jgi:hypothetical protein
MINVRTPLARACRPALLAPALVLLLAACGGGSSNETPPPEGRATALAASRPGELAAYVQERLRTLDAQGRLAGALAADGAPTIGISVSPVASAAPSASRTLVQEGGVDEPDLIQTDGRTLYTLQPAATGGGAVLQVHARDSSSGKASRITSLALNSAGGGPIGSLGMVFSADQRALAVVGQRWTTVAPGDACATCITATTPIAPYPLRSGVAVQRVDVADPGNASAGERIEIDGHLVDSRRIGDRLFVVTQHRPVLPQPLATGSGSAAQRQALINALTAADLLPRMRRNGGAPEALLADTDCTLQAANASHSVQLTTVTVFNLASPTLAHSSRCFVGGSEALYMTPQSLYLATSRWELPDSPQQLLFPQGMSTDIHRFALDGGTLTYRASGSVTGHLGWDRDRKSLRLSEHAGHLRVLSFTGQTGWWGDVGNTNQAAAPSPATLTVLRESGSALQVVATLPNSRRPAAIGKPGEQVHGVRFVGDRGYVVTFRRTDPLYVLDLANPADPQVAGELEIAGFSDHLFPLAGGLLLGVGKDADSQGRTLGVKVALFDVSNPAQPTDRGTQVFGTTGSASALDFTRHGMGLLMNGNAARLALPVMLSATPWSGWQRGLQRLEVNTTTRTLSAKALLPVADDASGTSSLWLERAALIGDQVYHLNGANLATHDW